MSRQITFDEHGGPEVLRITAQRDPEPGPRDVRISIEAIGVNRLNALVRAGNAPRPIRLPGARLGIEATGRINALGVDVREFAIGDEVVVTAIPDMDTNGAYAEQLVIPVERVVKRPPQLDAAHAAAFWVAYSTSYGGLIEKARMQPGDRILITAASSSVGLASIQIANQIGAIPVAVTRSSEKREALIAAGAHHVIATDRENLLESTKELTGGSGVELILDMVMGPGLGELAKSARVGGKLVTVGWLDSRATPFPMHPLTIYRYMSFEHTLDSTVVRRMAAFLNAGLRTGVLAPTIDRIFPFEKVVAAHEYIERGSLMGKVVLTL